ncbi:SLBB domain-containing protein [Psychroflexus sp. CAK57W]|uniref:SLBB domain-containing protein n=1 Tax=Psychroflexus curvus TaxID=2873595 RepID=UPI001CCF765B|nr:SLBB domain-containing protein [Psychroflexus curvus]MBZ9786747.1 SLBB domain-containing protein [Psychroflexus curvus]
MKHIVIVFLVVIACSSSLFGQEFLQKGDLSQVKASQFSEQELRQINQELEANQMSFQEAQLVAEGKGMPKAEIAKLKARLESLPKQSESAELKGEDEKAYEKLQDSLKTYDGYQESGALTKDLDRLDEKNRVFGSELFTTKNLSFEPNQNQTTPANYILGPGDQLEIVLSGEQQFTFTGRVSTNGKLIIPNVGVVFVSGLQFEAAVSRIKLEMQKIFSSLRTGDSRLSVTVSNYRSIFVTIIGAKQPGNYKVSSMSTVFNALHIAGGPNALGSYRAIELIRDNEVIRTIDLYDFLTKGDQSDNLALQDNDIIRIPTFKGRIDLKGEFKNPGIYEILPGEDLDQIINYASGFTEDAYLNRILVRQKTDNELRIEDLNSKNYKSYLPLAGDEVIVAGILNRYENRVQIKGAVYRPGDYSLKEGETLKVSDLIEKADGVKENVFLPKASLIRQKKDLTTEYIDIDLQAVLSGEESSNLELQREDILVVFYDETLLESFTNTIEGEVREPGIYPYSEDKTLYDLLLEAGYFTEKASQKVIVYRRIISDDYIPADQEKLINFQLEIDPQNPEKAANFMLMPQDHVIVRKIVSYEVPSMVTLEGEVLYPGQYALIKENEKLTDFIKRSGGFTDLAFLKSVRILRNDKIIPIDWSEIEKSKGTADIFTLEPGDVVQVPKRSQTVVVEGSVMLETEVIYKKNRRLRYYLKNAGGVADDGMKRKTFIIYPNGSAANTKSFLGFKSYPKVQPGSRIVVPAKPEREGLDVTQIIGLASTLASLAAIIFGITR